LICDIAGPLGSHWDYAWIQLAMPCRTNSAKPDALSVSSAELNACRLSLS
jgi:hypothetical protein